MLKCEWVPLYSCMDIPYYGYDGREGRCYNYDIVDSLLSVKFKVVSKKA